METLNKYFIKYCGRGIVIRAKDYNNAIDIFCKYNKGYKVIAYVDDKEDDNITFYANRYIKQFKIKEHYGAAYGEICEDNDNTAADMYVYG